MMKFYQTYAANLCRLLNKYKWDGVNILAEDLQTIWGNNIQNDFRLQDVLIAV